MSLGNQIELTKEQIDQIETSIQKSRHPYFGNGNVRYERNISDNGLYLEDVEKLMAHVPKEAWDDVKAILKTDLKATIEAQKKPFGELTKKPESERLEYKSIKSK